MGGLLDIQNTGGPSQERKAADEVESLVPNGVILRTDRGYVAARRVQNDRATAYS